VHKLELAWVSAGLPFGRVEVLDRWDRAKTGDLFLAVVHERFGPVSVGSLVIVRELKPMAGLYVMAMDNRNVLFA
jgi:hypothetical protein